MKKGINALELVFMMFILIVVTLVLIRLFTGIVRQDTLPKIDEFQNAYNYDKEKVRCGNLCNSYTSGGCSDTMAAVSYCRERVHVDINGDFNTNQRKAYGIVAGEPFCEDGLYCFHIYKCECGYVELDAKECLSIMKEHYLERTGDEATANEAVCKAVQPGECEKDPRLWTKKLPGFEPIVIKQGPYAGQVWGADFWWKRAGYAEICGEIGPIGGLQLSCSGTSPSTPTGNDGKITCSLQCNQGKVSIAGKDINDNSFYQELNVQTTTTFSGLTKPGGDTKKYTIMLECENPNGSLLLRCDENFVCTTATTV